MKMGNTLRYQPIRIITVIVDFYQNVYERGID